MLPFLENYDRPLFFAHRGLSARAPENTLAAFKLAWDSGVPGVELDIRLCATEDIVVFHDNDLERITGKQGTIEQSDLDELKSYDAGEGEKIPLLSEVFEAAPPDVYFDIEMKLAVRLCSDKLTQKNLKPGAGRIILKAPYTET